MTQYSLTIQIDDKGLAKIANSGKRVTLVKSSGKPSRVAWVSFDPTQTTTVTWDENYYVYATKTSQQGGAVIRMTSQTHEPVSTSLKYTFEHGFFTSGPGGAGGSFTVDNEQADNSLTPFNFGLAQEATINGTKSFAPLNMVPADKGDTIEFTPIETVSIYLSDLQDNGVVISDVASKALTVSLTSDKPNANVFLEDDNDTFHLGSLPSAA